jgi:hypothetical protein
MPLLLLGLAITWLISCLLSVRWRSPVRLLGAVVSASVVGMLLHPWVGLQKLGTTSDAHGVAIKLVSTGVLPIRASAKTGDHYSDLINGQVGNVRMDLVQGQDAYNVTVNPHFGLWWWAVVIAVCLSPLLWTFLVGLAPLPITAVEASADEDP